MLKIALVVAGMLLGIAMASLWQNDAPAAHATDAAPQPSARFDQLEQQIERLQARLSWLEEAAPAPGRERLQAVDRAPLPQPEVEALLAAIDNARLRRERARFADLDDATLLQRARWLSSEEANPQDAQQALETLLARPTSAVLRARAAAALGGVLYRRGDFATAARSLQMAITLTGLDTDEGSGAARFLIQVLEETGNQQGALVMADALVRSQGNETLQRLTDRFTAARLAQDLGDPERARRDFAGILRDCDAVANSASLRQTVESCMQHR